MTLLKLTAEQRLAAGTPSRLVYIDSAPGSGKTTVAAERFGTERFADAGDPRGVLGLSFARSAAAELRERVEARWGAAGLDFPHDVLTLDEMHVRTLAMLISSGSVSWPRNVDGFEVVDDYSADSKFSRVQAGSYKRFAFLTKRHTIGSVSREVTTPTLGLRHGFTHLSVLQRGLISHEDVRSVLTDAYGRQDLRALIADFIKLNYRSLIVDEIYDAASLDITLIETARDAGIRVTVVGDPRQALYGWRGATPDLVPGLIAGPPAFRVYNLSASFRFRGPQMPTVTKELRAGRGVTLPAGESTDVDVALGHQWARLWEVGDNILPLAFKSSGSNLDAAIVLLLDTVVQEAFNIPAFGREQALIRLGLAESTDEQRHEVFRPILRAVAQLIDPADIVAMIKDGVKTLGSKVVIRGGPGDSARHASLRRLGARLTHAQPLIQGLTVHQAKGRQWPRVGVVLTERARRLLESGLRPLIDDDCVVYVAITRAEERCVELRSASASTAEDGAAR